MEPKTLLNRLSEHYLLHLKPQGGIHYKPTDFNTPQSLLAFDGLVLKPLHKACDDCNRIVRKPSMTYQLKNTRKETYWLKKCDICSKKTEIKHPLKQEK